MTPTLQSLVVDLNISAGDLKRIYRGDAQQVIARSRDGRMVRFPANRLRPFVTEHGVQGRFELRFDCDYRLQDISRLNSS